MSQVAWSEPEQSPGSRPTSLLRNRWLQLLAGICGMVAIANLQYGWTLFVDPIQEKYHWSKPEIQWAFTILILMESWLVPFEAYLVDRYGPRFMLALSGLLIAAAWVVNSRADSLPMLYFGAAIGGIGAGIVYGTSMGSALKWFPDRRGLAAGLTAAAYGAGAALTVKPIADTINNHGYEEAFFWFGLGQGLVVLLVALVMRFPRGKELQVSYQAKVVQTGMDFTPAQMLRTPAFWLLYAMLTMVSVGGLMATAQLGPMARSLQVADVNVTLLGVTMAALPMAMALDRVLNGLTRPFFGWISDHLGREKTMLIAFTLEGFAILLLLKLAHIPLMFVLFSGLTYFAWGEAYSLFPALLGDMYGRKFATTNYGLLYTAKGTAALLVPLGSILYDRTGSWVPIFALAIAFDWTAALAAWFVIRPLRQRWAAGESKCQ